jgi:WD40 repeat protein/serine/threonine protein kinase/Flp pilus assembly protein TadD
MEWKVGSVINDNYEIKEKIDTGGMGTVYLCYSRNFHEPMAIKTFKETIGNTALKRLRKEAEIWTNLCLKKKHQNIVTAKYVEDIDNRLCIFLEMVTGDKELGTTLEERLNILGNLDIRTAVLYAIQICSGMIFADERSKETGQDFVHRDLKPSNIMVTSYNTIKITDFGLSKAFILDKESNLSEDKSEQSGSSSDNSSFILGTAPYMSPEQFNSFDDVDIRTDIYSFGCILYQMVCGHRPFSIPYSESITEKDKLDMYIKLHNDKIPSDINEYVPNCPPKLTQVIKKCLEKKKENRFENFNDVKKDLIKIYNKMPGEKYEERNFFAREDLSDINNAGISFDRLKLYDKALDCFNEGIKQREQEIEKRINWLSSLLTGKANEEQLQFNPFSILGYISRIKNGNLYGLIYKNKGDTLNNLSRYKEALECYNKAIKVDPEMKNAYMEKALVLMKMNMPDDAAECLDSLMEMSPEDEVYKYLKGAVSMMMKDYEEAEFYFRASINLNKEYKAPYIQIAEMASNKKDYNKSLYYIDKYLEVKPDDIEMLLKKGTVLAASGKPAEAKIFFQEVQKASPSDHDSLLDKGNALYKLAIVQNNSLYLRDALECFNNVIQVNRFDEKAWQMKGHILSALNRFEEAIRCFNEVLVINIDNNDTIFEKGKALLALGSYEKAQKYLEKAFIQNPGDSKILLNIALVKEALNDLNSAYTHFKALSVQNPHNPFYLYKIGVLLNKSKNYQDALKYLDVSLSLDPANYSTLGEKASSLIMLKKYIEADKCFESAERIVPASSDNIKDDSINLNKYTVNDFADLLQNLYEGKRLEELTNVLFDLNWMLQKLNYTDEDYKYDAYDLIKDYNLLGHDNDIGIIIEAFKLSASIINKDRTQLLSQLMGRINFKLSDRLAGLYSGIVNSKHKPLIYPLLPTLNSPHGQLKMNLKGHTGQINKLLLINDNILISCSEDKTIRVWDIESGKCIHILTGHKSEITTIINAKKSSNIISIASDAIKVWDTHDFRLVKSIDNENSVITSMNSFYTNSGEFLIVAYLNGTMKIRDLDKDRCIKTIKETGIEGSSTKSSYINSIVVCDEKHIAFTGSEDCKIKFWDLQDENNVRCIDEFCSSLGDGLRVRVHTLLSDKTNLLVSYSSNADVYYCFLDLNTKKLSEGIYLERRLFDVTLSKDEKTLFVYSGNNYGISLEQSVVMVDIEKRAIINIYDGHSARVNSVTELPNLPYAISCSSDSTIKVWQVNTSNNILIGHSNQIGCLAFSGSNNFLATGSKEYWDGDGKDTGFDVFKNTRYIKDKRVIKIWYFHTNTSTFSYIKLINELEGFKGGINTIIFSKNYGTLVTQSTDNSLNIWDFINGNLKYSLRTANPIILMYDNDKKLIYSEYEGLENYTYIKLWDLENNRLYKKFKAHSHIVSALLITPDERCLITASEDLTIKIWNLEKNKLKFTLKGHETWIEAALISPDGCHIFSTSYDRILKIWDIETGQCIKSVDDFGKLLSLSSDYSYALSVSSGNLSGLKLWRIEKNNQIPELFLHNNLAAKTEHRLITKDGRYLIFNEDESLYVHDIKNKQNIACFSIDYKITALSLTPNNKALAIGDQSGKVHILSLENIKPGYPFVTAVRFSKRQSFFKKDIIDGFKCPVCNNRSLLSLSGYQTVTCKHCNNNLKPTPFVFESDYEKLPEMFI